MKILFAAVLLTLSCAAVARAQFDSGQISSSSSRFGYESNAFNDSNIVQPGRDLGGSGLGIIRVEVALSKKDQH